MSANPEAKVYLMIRRKKITVVTDAKKSTSTLELKRMLEKMLKVPPDNQRLMYNEVILEDSDTLESVGITAAGSPLYRPTTLVLVLSQEDGDFEPPEISPFTPVDAPTVLPELTESPRSGSSQPTDNTQSRSPRAGSAR
ncbi:Elongin-B [Amphibalanus amphitrite]|uniref:Elongin-B n=1 Tax=Amphibalanus amphitrite TaxID=1232801 RepID=A0A6A4V3E5_AMPAM|nr:elongin-B-like [Amphibalanus amphitrite]KAF0287629.1 Elongin-B [Amphibalanus amphitrite]